MTRRCSLWKSSCADGGSCGVIGRRAATADDDAEGRVLGLRTGGSLARLPEAPIEGEIEGPLLAALAFYGHGRQGEDPGESPRESRSL